MGLRLPQHLGVVAIEKWASESPSTKVANFTKFRGLQFNVVIAPSALKYICTAWSELT